MAEIAILVCVRQGQAPLWNAMASSLKSEGTARGVRPVLLGEAEELAACSDAGLAPRRIHLQGNPAGAWAELLGDDRSSWLSWCQLDAPVPPGWTQRLQTAVDAAADDCPFVSVTPGGPTAWHGGAVRLGSLRPSGLEPDPALKDTLASESLLWRLLISTGAQPEGAALAALTAPRPEPERTHWRQLQTYDSVLEQAFALPLQQACAKTGTAPEWLQTAVAQHLHWYFTVDARQRAPTMRVDEAMAQGFHDRMRAAARHLQMSTLSRLAEQGVPVEACHALLSYQGLQAHGLPTLDRLDQEQGLVRATYYLHGERPSETWTLDGEEEAPAFGKYRGCKFFHRLLYRQRIAWLPIADRRTLSLALDGEMTPLALGQPSFGLRQVSAPGPLGEQAFDLKRARSHFPLGKGGQKPLPPGWGGWKVRLLRALAALPLVRWRYRNAWVFVDREGDADDNAEHLYRWVRENHPEVNGWFLLQRESSDWPRLQKEGFRLMPPGIARQLLILNSEHLISSHTDYVYGGFDPARYGDAMRWRFSWPQHGVIKDDISHWLSPLDFDLFITSSPAEHKSIVGDDTAYPFTEKETKRVGLPRHDRLFRIARDLNSAEVRDVLVMPTWRGSLVDERSAGRTQAERLELFAASDYARHWRSMLGSEVLKEQLERHGRRLVFMPHINAWHFVEAFDPPPHVHVLGIDGGQAQQAFARTAVFVTDYTSVALTMAFLRRCVVYYQFDRETFYAGDHNWRPGYFNYERDGFGPVALTEDRLLDELRRCFESGCRPSSEYLARMEKAMPDHDDGACLRNYEGVLALRKPWQPAIAATASK